jgi:hypothetical protein
MKSQQRERAWMATLAGACSALIAAGAHAQAPPPSYGELSEFKPEERRTIDASYFALALNVGLGGEVAIEGARLAPALGGRGGSESGLEPSFGAALQYSVRLHRHFGVGARLAFQSWQGADAADASDARNGVIDVMVVPAGKLSLASDLELHVAVLLGMSMDFIDDGSRLVDLSPFDFAAGVDIDEAIGFVMVPSIGARLAVTPAFGVLVEAGYSLRWYEHEILVWDSVDDLTADVHTSEPFDLALGQFVLSAGVFF